MFRLLFFVFLFLQISLSFADSYIIRIDDNNKSILKNDNLRAERIFNFNLQNKKINNFLLSNREQEFYLNRLQQYFTLTADKAIDMKQFAGNIEEKRKYKVNTITNPDNYANNQWNLKQIKVTPAWKKATGKGIIISLIDTGIDFEHPDLKNSLWINDKEDLNKNGTYEPWSYLETRNGLTGDFNGIDEDANGYTDDVIGFDFVDQYQVAFGDYIQPDPVPEDEGEHGTNVAGVMIARPTSDTSMIGVAYDAKLMIAKAFDITGNAEADDIAKAIVYSVLNGAKVINMSFGDNYPSQIVYDAIRFAYYSGCILVSSSGNNGWNLPHYPSDYPEVISVGGSDETGKRWSFGNYGPYVDLIAPARNIYTTDVGKSYKRTNGTSVAAPHVSGIAAILLELNNNLKIDDIKTILQMTAFQDKDDYDAWYFYGAGVLDAARAVDNIYTGKVRFNSPSFDYIFDRTTDSLNINATISNPLFDRAEILISNRIDTIKWRTLVPISEQGINKDFGKIHQEEFTNGVNYLAIRVYLKNQRYYDEIIPVYYNDNNIKIAFNYLNNFSAYYNEKRVTVVGANTTRISEFYVKYRPITSSGDYQIAKEYIRYSKNHYVIIDGLIPKMKYVAVAVAISGNDTLEQNFEFTQDEGYWTTANFALKQYSTNRSYIYNGTTDLYGDKPTFAVNDLQTLFIGKTFTKQLVDGKIVNRDSLQRGYIPVGFGDSNGDGIKEILTSAEFNSILYQSKTKNGNPFESELFKNAGNSLWGEQFFDIDNDGKDEIIGYSYEVQDKSYKVIKYVDGKYIYKDTLKLPSGFINVSIERGSAIEDLDGDGFYELAFINTRGNLFIYEYRPDKGFVYEYIDSTEVGLSNQYMTKADIDGDGIYEVLHGSYGSNILHSRFGTSDPVWRFRVIKSNGANEYSTIWQEFFVPVRDGSTRQGFFYRNGVSAGNLDNEPGDEIVLLPFPNLYILKWNKQENKFENMWHYPSSLSNSAIIADLDGNGINEIGFTSFNSMRFFEYILPKASLNPPNNPDGWSENQTEAYLEWSEVANAEKYNIYQLIPQNGELNAVKLGETTSTSVVISSLKENNTYNFVITSYSAKFQSPESDFSNLISVSTRKAAKPIKVEIINNNQINLVFEGKAGTNSLNPGLFKLNDGQKQFLPSSAIISKDSIAMLSFADKFSDRIFSIQVDRFRDYYNNWSKDTTLEFEWKMKDEPEELYLTKLEFLSETLIKIYFNKEADSSAIIRDNYVFKPIGEALYVELDPIDNKAILMNISQLFRSKGARGNNYTITAQNIFAKDKTPITKGAGNTLGFVINASELTDAYIYPNPIKRSEEPEIFFANLTQTATVTIQTLDGAEIIKLYENDGNGGLEWDGRDRNGKLLPTGIYVFTVEGKNSQGVSVFSETKKFVIIP